MDRKRTLVNIYIVVFFSVFVGSNCSQICDLKILRQTMVSLQKSLDYFKAHTTELNIDGAVASRICSDQLETILDSENIMYLPFDVYFQLRRLKEISDEITFRSKPFALFNSNEEAINLIALLEPGTWKLNYAPRNVDFHLITPSSCSSSEFMENKSDYCLAELLPHRFSGESCRISSSCWDMVMTPGFNYYALTHQLLYLQVAEMYNCGRKTPLLRGDNLMSLHDVLCTNIYRDATAISRANYPDSHRDIFSEQIGLCGMMGYTDFWRRDWMDTILGWQTPLGCYFHPKRWACTEDLRKTEEGRRYKREDIFTTDGCSVHMTGVAALAMTIDIKFCLQHLTQYRRPLDKIHD